MGVVVLVLNLRIATMMVTVQNMAEQVVAVPLEVLMWAEMAEALFLGLVLEPQEEEVQVRPGVLEVRGVVTLLLEAGLLGHRAVVKMVQMVHREATGVEMAAVVDKE